MVMLVVVLAVVVMVLLLLLSGVVVGGGDGGGGSSGDLVEWWGVKCVCVRVVEGCSTFVRPWRRAVPCVYSAGR